MFAKAFFRPITRICQRTMSTEREQQVISNLNQVRQQVTDLSKTVSFFLIIK